MSDNSVYGSPHSGYVGQDVGPFKCATCEHLKFPHFCNHPDVIKDAKNKSQGLYIQGNVAVVHLSRCCGYWRPRS